MKTKFFAVMWCNQGLETVAEVPSPAEYTFAKLANQSPPTGPNLGHWRIRAQANIQRCYEIYLISADSGIEKEDIESMFEACPQTAADTVRQIGQCFHSDRASQDCVVIR